MDKNAVKASIIINATASKIWDVLTNPDKIALYTGSQTHTDWVVDSPITWEGEMHGTKFRNKGDVLENVSNKLLRFTYWSGMGGDADLPENYSEVAYTLKQSNDNSTELIYSRIKIATEIEAQIFQGHIQSMLEEIKRLSEKS
ncbi:MAG: SRPBCC domain-containing protein [Cyclobacteriaceae bacterium]